MPSNINDAISFLETQWSNINENKLKGIEAEVRFRSWLTLKNVIFINGGWLVTPGKNTNSLIPPLDKICLLPLDFEFSWQGTAGLKSHSPSYGHITAYSYFRQLGMATYFVRPVDVNEGAFQLPMPKNKSSSKKAQYPRSYNLEFLSYTSTGLQSVSLPNVMTNFPRRNGNTGLQCRPTNRLKRHQSPWNNPDLVSELFWFEYARYYCQVDYLVSNNDLDLFVIGASGQAYPVEMKSKTAVQDKTLGDWFGIDSGTFAKMSFFTSNTMNTDALFVVEEIDDKSQHKDWLAVKFTDLVKGCSWVTQSGGQGMMGGASNTFKIPKALFTPLALLILSL